MHHVQIYCDINCFKEAHFTIAKFEKQLDSLAGFLGHDIHVHRNFYRLPEDTIQIAKVSKILLQLEKGEIHKCKGKNLDEINMDVDEYVEHQELDMDVMAESETMANEDEIEAVQDNPGPSNTVPPLQKAPVRRKMSKTSSKRSVWTTEEKNAVKRQLGKFFAMSKLPGKGDIEAAKREEPVLFSRPWTQIKFFIRNYKISKANQIL